MTWLLVFITLVFSIVGALIMGMGFSILAFPGTDLAHRALEFKLLGAFFIVSPWISILFLRLRNRKNRSFHRGILEEGSRKRAVLIDFEETGTYVNNDPRVRLVMQVKEENGESRKQVFTGIVPVARAVGFRPGMELDITESPKGVVIHWPEPD